MIESVPARVQRGIPQAEVGTEVDHKPDAVYQGLDKVLRSSRGKGDEHDVEAVEARRIEARISEVAIGRRQVRIELADRGPRRSVSLDEHDLEARMGRKQPQQLRPQVSRRPGDSGLHRHDDTAGRVVMQNLRPRSLRSGGDVSANEDEGGDDEGSDDVCRHRYDGRAERGDS